MLACVVSLSLVGVFSSSCAGDKEAEGAELGAEEGGEEAADGEKKDKKGKKGKKDKKGKKKKK
jgi:hypothetical protein